MCDDYVKLEHDRDIKIEQIDSVNVEGVAKARMSPKARMLPIRLEEFLYVAELGGPLAVEASTEIEEC